MMCQSIGRPPISIIGFGTTAVSSARRVPWPPARMTTFTFPSSPSRAAGDGGQLLLGEGAPVRVWSDRTWDRAAILPACRVAVDPIDHLKGDRLSLVHLNGNRIHGADGGIDHQRALAQEVSGDPHPADVAAGRFWPPPPLRVVVCGHERADAIFVVQEEIGYEHVSRLQHLVRYLERDRAAYIDRLAARPIVGDHADPPQLDHAIARRRRQLGPLAIGS